MIGGGLARTLVRKAVAAAVAAGAALVAVIAFGATVFYALCLVVPELAAAAITFLLFALAALAVTVIFLRRDAAGPHQPGEGSLDDPSAGQHLEAAPLRDGARGPRCRRRPRPGGRRADGGGLQLDPPR